MYFNNKALLLQIDYLI